MLKHTYINNKQIITFLKEIVKQNYHSTQKMLQYRIDNPLIVSTPTTKVQYYLLDNLNHYLKQYNYSDKQLSEISSNISVKLSQMLDKVNNSIVWPKEKAPQLLKTFYENLNKEHEYDRFSEINN